MTRILSTEEVAELQRLAVDALSNYGASFGAPDVLNLVETIAALQAKLAESEASVAEITCVSMDQERTEDALRAKLTAAEAERDDLRAHGDRDVKRLEDLLEGQRNSYAAENARLREAREEMQSKFLMWRRRAIRAEAENARLREALEALEGHGAIEKLRLLRDAADHPDQSPCAAIRFDQESGAFVRAMLRHVDAALATAEPKDA